VVSDRRKEFMEHLIATCELVFSVMFNMKLADLPKCCVHLNTFRSIRWINVSIKI